MQIHVFIHYVNDIHVYEICFLIIILVFFLYGDEWALVSIWLTFLCQVSRKSPNDCKYKKTIALAKIREKNNIMLHNQSYPNKSHHLLNILENKYSWMNHQCYHNGHLCHSYASDLHIPLCLRRNNGSLIKYFNEWIVDVVVKVMFVSNIPSFHANSSARTW